MQTLHPEAKSPVIQRRLDYWLLSDSYQEEVNDVDTIPSINSDHSVIVLHLNSIKEQRHGPSYWKFNASLLDDPKYVSLINDNIPVWRREFVEVNDKRVLWDLIKYRIKQVTIKFSKDKAKARRDKLRIIENSLKECEVDCGKSPSPDNIEKLEFLKHEYDSCYEYLLKGAIIRSRATWYEYGEKSNKYFLNLETQESPRAASVKHIRKMAL